MDRLRPTWPAASRTSVQWNIDYLAVKLRLNPGPQTADPTPEPPLTPSESIPAVGRYLCFVEPRLKSGLPGDRRVLLAVAYRTSYETVNDAGGVPPKYRDHAARVAHYLKEYTPPGKR
ncbi:hypothetical protein GCM10027074_30450 [Streptomyces deserti]